MTETDQDILVSIENGIGEITLNRPQARNALSRKIMAQLSEILDQMKADQDVRVVVIGHTGPAFSAGHDLKEVKSNPSREFYETLFKECSELMQRIVMLPKPVIAKVNGIATAAGCQLVASCDLAVVSETSRFATPGVNIGLFCSTPMVALSRNVSRKQAMKMLLTGELISAAEACHMGLEFFQL